MQYLLDTPVAMVNPLVVKQVCELVVDDVLYTKETDPNTGALLENKVLTVGSIAVSVSPAAPNPLNTVLKYTIGKRVGAGATDLVYVTCPVETLFWGQWGTDTGFYTLDTPHFQPAVADTMGSVALLEVIEWLAVEEEKQVFGITTNLDRYYLANGLQVKGI